MLQQIAAANAGTAWADIEKLLTSLGAHVEERAGSGIAVELDDRVLYVHRPHPRRECGRGLIKQVRAFLRATGHIQGRQ